MTSPTSTALGLSKWVGFESSKSASKASLYLCMGAPVVRNEVVEHPFSRCVERPPIDVTAEARNAA